MCLIFLCPGGFAEKLRVGVIGESANHWPLWIAEEKGYFRQEGLEVEVLATPDAAKQLEGLVQGRYEITHQAADHFIGAAEAGKDVFIFMTISRPIFDFIVRPGISSIADLKGKTIALDQLTTSYWLLFRKVFAQGGLRPEDYHLLPNLGGAENRWRAVEENRAQGTYLNPPLSLQAMSRGYARLTGLAERFPDFPGSSGGARRAWAKQHEQSLVGYLQAYIRAVDWLLLPGNREEALAIFAKRMKIDQRELAGSYDSFVQGGLVRSASLSRDGIQQVLDLMAESGQLTPPLAPPEKYIDASYQQKALSPAIRLDSALDDIVPPGAKVEKLAGDFGFLEGPVWIRKGGYLVFSDIPGNVIHKWNPTDGKVSTLLKPSGFTGSDATGVGRQSTNGTTTFYNIGSNGIAMDPQGRLVFVAMGDRQIVRLEQDGRRTVLASHYEDKRLNSGNDLVYKSNGSLYFTDPPSGLRDGDNDPTKELPYNGVFLLQGGKLQLLTKDVKWPNGIAFSPDEKVLYVADITTRTVVRFEVQPDDTVAKGRVFVDMSPDKAPGNPDGMKVDQKGNLYCAGAGGIWIISPEGKHLGTLWFPEQPANFDFGDADGKTLYVTARSGLYRIRLMIPGARL
jgi:gluconolactonase